MGSEPAVEVFSGDDAPAASAEAAPSAPAETGEATPPAEGAAPEAAPEAAPWWERAVPGKWKDEESALKGYAESSKEARRLADEAKAAGEKAAEFETKWGTVAPLVGAPVNEDGTPAPYDWKFPEGATPDKLLVGAFENFLRENNLSNTIAQKGATLIAGYEEAIEAGRREYEKGRVVESLGGGDENVAKAASSDAFKWAAGVLGDDEQAVEDLRECGGVGAAINTLHRLRAALSGVSGGNSMGGGAGLNAEQYSAIVSTPGWSNDAAKVAQVNEYLTRVAGTGGGAKEQDG